MKTKKTIFTLLELLITIAIISILSSMLLPMLQKAKGRVQQINCLNNMKQIYLIFSNYSDDSNDFLPPNGLFIDTVRQYWLYYFLTNGYLKNPNIALCPYFYPNKYIPTDGARYAMSYGGPQRLFIKRNDIIRQFKSESPSPSNFIILADTIHADNNPQRQYYYFAYSNSASPNCHINIRHNKSANCTMLDGSAAGKTFSQIQRPPYGLYFGYYPTVY